MTLTLLSQSTGADASSSGVPVSGARPDNLALRRWSRPLPAPLTVANKPSSGGGTSSTDSPLVVELGQPDGVQPRPPSPLRAEGHAVAPRTRPKAPGWRGWAVWG